jgi:hypothetical protein
MSRNPRKTRKSYGKKRRTLKTKKMRGGVKLSRSKSKAMDYEQEVKNGAKIEIESGYKTLDRFMVEKVFKAPSKPFEYKGYLFKTSGGSMNMSLLAAKKERPYEFVQIYIYSDH